MEKIYQNLTQYEKKHKWSKRFGPLYRLYISKLWSRLIKDGKSWIFNAIMLLPILAGPIVAFAYQPGVDEFFRIYSDIMFLGYFGIIIPLFTMYIASMMFNDERGDRSITYLTSRPIHRFELIIVKYISYLTIVPLFTTIITLINYLSFGVFGAFQYFDMAWWFMIISFIASAVYGAFFMLIGLLFKNPLWFGLVYVFIWEFVLASFSPTLNSMTIAYYIKSFIVYPIYPSNIIRKSPALISGSQATIFNSLNVPASGITIIAVLVGVVVVAIVLSWSVLQGDRLRVPYQAGRRPGGWKYYLKEIRSYLITFGILLIAAGLVVGPINGVTKLVSSRGNGDIDFEIYSGWYDPNVENSPDLDDMGWGYIYTYPLTKGDSVEITFGASYVSGETYDMAGVILLEEDYLTFFTEMQDLWVAWAEEAYFNPYNESRYRSLIDNYSTEAESLITVDAVDYVYFTDLTPQSLDLDMTSRNDYVFLAIVTDYDNTLNVNFYVDGITIDVEGQVFRRVGYAFGYVLLGFGVVSLGVSIYSLITYSSEIEIKRYEEKVARFEEQARTKEIQQ